MLYLLSNSRQKTIYFYADSDINLLYNFNKKKFIMLYGWENYIKKFSYTVDEQLEVTKQKLLTKLFDIFIIRAILSTLIHKI